ncbi:MAG: hypothetical protein WBP64_07995 [Nitrososphaeraceae archaeon]
MIALIITVTNSLDLATISTAAQSTPKSNNISAINSVTIGDNLVLFSALSNLSPNNPHPIKSQCFNYGFVANNKPLGNLLIIKYRNDGSCTPTIELFSSIGTVLGIIPAQGDQLKLGYNALIFIKYIVQPR